MDYAVIYSDQENKQQRVGENNTIVMIKSTVGVLTQCFKWQMASLTVYTKCKYEPILNRTSGSAMFVIYVSCILSMFRVFSR